MHTAQLQNSNIFTLYDETEQVTYQGFDQEWYSKKWHRMAGCGPTTSSQIIFYLKQHKGVFGPPLEWKRKADSLILMDALWKEVTPKMQGVHKTSILSNGVMRYAKNHGVALTTNSLPIAKNVSQRPQPSQIADFLIKSLSNDIPIAFLNKHQGDCENLEGWHWVTIIGCRWEEETNLLWATILDGGKQLDIDLTLWCRTTKLGGGFVAFQLI